MWELLAYALLAAGSLYSAYKTNKTNKEIYENQNAFNEQMQDKQNEYNLPSNQVDRLKDAGINPVAGLMSNGLSVSGNTSAPINQSTAFPFVDPMTQLSNNALSLMNSYKMNAEGKTANSLRQYEIDRIKAQTSDYLANVAKLGVDTKGQMIANDYAVALNELALSKGKSEISYTYQQIATLRAQEDKLKYEITSVLPQQVQESISRTGLNVLEQDKVVAEIERIFYEEENLSSQTALNQSEIEKNAASVGLMEAQTATETARRENIEVSTDVAKSEKTSLDQQIQLFLDTYDSQIQFAASRAKLTKKEANTFYLRNLISGGKAASSGAAATIGAVAGAAKYAPAAAPVVVAGF